MLHAQYTRKQVSNRSTSVSQHGTARPSPAWRRHVLLGATGTAAAPQELLVRCPLSVARSRHLPRRARALCAYAGALLLRVSPSRSWCARIHGRTLAGRRAPPSSAPARAAPSSLSLTQPPPTTTHHPATHHTPTHHPHHRRPARAELRCSAAAAAAAAAGAARAAAISTATGHTI